MQKILNLLLSIFLVGTSAFGETVINGTFVSLPSAEFRIVANQSFLNDYQGELLKQGKTNDKGEFIASFNIISEQPVILFIDKIFLKLWIIPNTSLTIQEAINNVYTFSGEAEKQNTFFFQTGIMMPFKIPGSISTETFEPQKQFTYLDSIETARLFLYNQIFSNKVPSFKFESYCKAEILHSSIMSKSQYPLGYIYMKKTLKVEDIPANYYNFWTKFKLYEDSCLSDSYQYSINSFMQYIATKKMNNDISDVEQFNQLLFTIADSLLVNRPLTLQKQKTDILLTLIKYFDTPVLVQKEFENYKRDFPESPSLELLGNEKDKKTKNTLTTPSFRLKSNTGKLVDIKDLRGKVVYIDFWGSWCKACLAQMPNSATVQKKFKNKDVVFLFIDFYDTKEKWLKTIKERKLSGLHVKAEKTDEEYFDNIFGIKQGFPRYALLDKDGRLITTSAPHPNNNKLIDFIETHLN